MRLVFLIPILFLFASACEAPRKTAEESPAEGKDEVANYTYTLQNVEEKQKDCVGECAKVTLNYPVFETGPELHKRVNEQIRDQLGTSLSDFIMEAEGKEPLDQLIRMFLDDYQKFKENFPESKTPWYVMIDVIVSFTNDRFVSLAFNTSSYTGGAHPNTYMSYLNLDNSGKKISGLDYFFLKPEELSGLAEKQFRSQNGINSDQALSDRGYIFENDEFALPETFGFTSSGVVFYFNSYEIAPYAEGPTALIVPFSELKGNYKYGLNQL